MSFSPEDDDAVSDAEEEAVPEAEEAKVEEEEVIAHPDTPVPSLDEMRAALDWAFEAEEDVGEGVLDLFARHALHLLERNRVMNLTAILEPREVAAKHYLDSWRNNRLVPLVARKVVDQGTGAGFPGLPLAIAEPNLSMTLIDSTAKKVEFLDECIQALDIKNIRAVAERAEIWLTTNRVDVVLVRFVSSVRENVRTLRKVRHSLKDLVMLKGGSWSREVRAGEREAERLGFKLDTVWEHELPEGMGSRAILVYRAPGGQGA
jgi:16S rRNA (guanine527-N7)-methyltransferase